MAIILKRKLLTAFLSSLLFALIFSSLGGFDGNAFMNFYYLNLMIVITYGVITSFFSDWLSSKVSKKAYIREIISFLLHCLFGGTFQVLSLVSSVLFFIVDRLLSRVKIGWLSVIIAFLIVVLVFIIAVNR
ncbi:hypothetical protein ACQKL5_08670 [Peribacillus sp. NPDC097675]|uniref:hypothetical protein n=1 Tax=Peribacillus sp. NPDC097675 TaxID=3390618 RepID=UPI003D052D0A